MLGLLQAMWCFVSCVAEGGDPSPEGSVANSAPAFYSPPLLERPNYRDLGRGVLGSEK